MSYLHDQSAIGRGSQAVYVAELTIHRAAGSRDEIMLSLSPRRGMGILNGASAVTRPRISVPRMRSLKRAINEQR